jgi:hypothetical protein
LNTPSSNVTASYVSSAATPFNIAIESWSGVTTTITLANANTPIVGSMMGGTEPGIPLGTLCDTSTASSPATGYLWTITAATGSMVVGSMTGDHALLFYVQPMAGDGGKFMFLGKTPGTKQTTDFGGGTASSSSAYYFWQQWTENFFVTPHMEVMFAQFSQVDDLSYFNVTFAQSEMGPNQTEVYFVAQPFAGSCTTSSQFDTAYAVGSISTASTLSTVPSSMEWIPGAWETNVSTGLTVGSRHSRIVAVPPGVSPTATPVTPMQPMSTLAPSLLSNTGEITNNSTGDNNSTGSWTPLGTAPQDNAGYHVVYPKGLKIPSGYTLYLVTDAYTDDMVKFGGGTCLQQPTS